MRPRNRHGKRRAQEWREPEEVVDDLAVAASFAQVIVPPPASPVVKQQETSSSDDSVTSSDQDENEIRTDEACIDSTRIQSTEQGQAPVAGAEIEKVKEQGRYVPGNKEEDAESSSDEDSEIDLTEALARMNGDSDDEQGTRQTSKKNNDTGINPPKTEHEVNPYETPLAELESKFQISLAVDKELDSLIQDQSLSHGSIQDNKEVQLCPAGNVKCHMIDERTVVVESIRTGSAPLDEGSLLVVKLDDDEDEEKTEARVIPLGKVFEVFGPVSQPLYTIRLPPPPSSVAKATAKPAGAKREKPNDLDQKGTTTSPNGETGNAVQEEDGTAETKQEDQTVQASVNDDENAISIQEEATCSTKDLGIDTAAVVEDVWSRTGQSTKMFQTVPNMTVYYIQNNAHTIDTAAIIQKSGKGCDASNVYDEEVVNTNEMAFSDDEQERAAKSRSRQKKRGGGRDQQRSNVARPSSFREQSNLQQPHGGGYRSNPGYAQGYRPPAPVGYNPCHGPPHYAQPSQPYPYQQSPTYPYQAQPLGYQPIAHQPIYPGYQTVPSGSAVLPPPPPPPPRPTQYTGNAEATYPQQGVTNPHQPGQSGQEESDTVYYDYT